MDDERTELADVWPPYGLRLRVDDLELRVPDDGDALAVARAAQQGVHPPERTPFSSGWTDVEPQRLPLETLRMLWTARAQLRPAAWALHFAVTRGNEVMGLQSIEATDFAVARTAVTGSWLASPYQGRGIGTSARTAVLALLFDHLGAVRARSGYLDGSDASQRVSQRLGYRPDGTATHVVRGEARTEQRLVITADDWHAAERPAVDVRGVEACRALLVGD